MKTKFTLFLFFIMTCAEAQYIPVRSTMSTPRGNIPTVNYVRMPTHYGSNTERVNSMKMSYYITLKNDSVLIINSFIDIKDETHCLRYKVKRTKKVIYPNDTKMVSCIEYRGTKYKGIPADTCWLFNSKYGKINTYSYFPGDVTTIAAIQEGDKGPIVKINRENVLIMVYRDPEAVKLVEKGQLLKALAKYNGWEK